MLDEIRAAGGEVFAITSEPQSLATDAEQDWEFRFTAIGDPHHEIRQTIKDRGWLDIFYNEDAGHLRERKWASHPKGYYQPATLALTRTGRVLYRWRCVPKYSNMSGAGARPEANYTWQHICEAMTDARDAEPDKDPVLGAEDLSWPRFLLILTAHGWFIRPKAFPLTREGDKKRISPNKMMTRVWIFVTIWLAAFATLPIQWTSTALVLWLIVLTPGLLEIHRQFQNEPNDY